MITTMLHAFSLFILVVTSVAPMYGQPNALADRPMRSLMTQRAAESLVLARDGSLSLVHKVELTTNAFPDNLQKGSANIVTLQVRPLCLLGKTGAKRLLFPATKPRVVVSCGEIIAIDYFDGNRSTSDWATVSEADGLVVVILQLGAEIPDTITISIEFRTGARLAVPAVLWIDRLVDNYLAQFQPSYRSTFHFEGDTEGLAYQCYQAGEVLHSSRDGEYSFDAYRPLTVRLDLANAHKDQ